VVPYPLRKPENLADVHKPSCTIVFVIWVVRITTPIPHFTPDSIKWITFTSKGSSVDNLTTHIESSAAFRAAALGSLGFRLEMASLSAPSFADIVGADVA
jgi:hypothetical protein